MDPKYNPVYLLRAYIWQVLKANTDMDESDYPNNIVPIIPVSDDPKLAELDKPYIVYGYAFDPTVSERHFIERGSLSLAVISPDFQEIGRILNILRTTFNREDDAARDINAFTSRSPAFVGVRFGTVGVGFVEGPSPEEVEGGRQSGLINIRFECFTEYNVITEV